MAVLINSLLAEVVANVITFVTIAPNHTGDDVHRFDSGPRSRAEFYLQQCAGSVNYPGGTDLQDYLQGYLNYQIEHHLFPDISHIHYPKISKIVKKTAKEYGIQYNYHRTFGSAIFNHLRLLKQLGRA